MTKPADWTGGHEAIFYQTCGACGRAQYFRRGFCAACGSCDLAEKRASGKGMVYATSVVTRAATPETRAHVPYNIVLIDAAEGFRMMAHGANDLGIGDAVTARFAQFAGRLVPYFEKTSSESFRGARSANPESRDSGSGPSDRPGMTE